MNAARTSRPKGRPPAADGPHTRERILDAALDGFARQGFAATSMRQIARAVGIRESAIYSHYASKQAIINALFAESGPAVVHEALARAGSDSRDPATVLRALVEHVVDAWDQPRARQVTSVIMREGGPASAVTGISVHDEIDQARKRLGTVFQRWMDAGLVRADVPAERLAWGLMAPIALVRLLYLTAEASEARRQDGRRLVREHLEYLLSVVTKGDPP